MFSQKPPTKNKFICYQSTKPVYNSSGQCSNQFLLMMQRKSNDMPYYYALTFLCIHMLNIMHAKWCPLMQNIYQTLGSYQPVLYMSSSWVRLHSALFFSLLVSESLTSCSSLVTALVCQPTGPCSIPGMSCSETAITRGNPIMLLPPTAANLNEWIHLYPNNALLTKTRKKGEKHMQV